MNRKILIIVLFSFFAINSKAQDRLNFNENWKFKLGDDSNRNVTNYNDVNWRELDLPHDWSIEGDYDKNNPTSHFAGYLPSGVAWYRKTIKIPSNWKNRHIEIAFDGISMNSTVWANGKKLGDRPYAWSSFSFDISEQVETSSTITFAVRVDNSKQPSARWYTGCGIYTNVWIDVDEKIHVPASGVFVSTKGSIAKIATEIKNDSSKETKISLSSFITDSLGKIVSKTNKKITINKGEQKKIYQKISVKQPKLWSVESPNLYNLVTKITSNGKLLDKVVTKFGFRDIQWIPETGMWINGKNVKLRGVCNHQDAGAFGAAVPDKILRFRIQQLKDMGVNTIRTSHNPQTPQFYAMCDEIGMMVMDEIFDGWEQKAEHDYGAHSFNEWWEKDLTDWIIRDRNHPSVIIYSVGNETHGEIGKKLVETCHMLDPTRLVTSGHSSDEYMDVFGANGGSEMKDWVLNDAKELMKNRVLIGTENTHTLQVRGYYRTKTWYRNGYPNVKRRPYYYPDLTDEEIFKNDWTSPNNKTNQKQIFLSSYDNATVRLNSRQNVELLRDIPHFAGSFRWTGYDYIGETKYHGGWPFKALSSGAIDIANFEKDLYYMYQSQWTQKPMAHILPHWTHPTLKLGTEIPVWVYSNCDEVELFFNGKSLGRQKPGMSWDKMQCEWLVPWKPGSLKAIAYKDGKEVVVKTISTAKAPSKIVLSIDGKPMTNKTKDFVQVRVKSTDEKGEFYPYGENRTYFHVIGSGKIRALDNGSPIDVEKHFEAKDRIAFYGLTRAYIQSTDKDGDINLIASAILGEKKQISSNVVSIDNKILNIRGASLKPKIDVYYTTNGLTPTKASKKYSKPFEVAMGTTVKAIVVLEGRVINEMGERFAEDEGFIFNSKAIATAGAGDQAEDAKLTNAFIKNEGSGFNGTGYVNLGEKNVSKIEWYYENDGGTGDFEILIRYSASKITRTNHKVELIINGVSQIIKLPVSNTFLTDWLTIKVPVKLDAGANTIEISSLQEDGLAIDEIKIK